VYCSYVRGGLAREQALWSGKERIEKEKAKKTKGENERRDREGVSTLSSLLFPHYGACSQASGGLKITAFLIKYTIVCYTLQSLYNHVCFSGSLMSWPLIAGLH